MPYKLGLLDVNGTLVKDVSIMYASSCHAFERFAPDVPVPSLDDFRTGCATIGEAEWHYQRGIPRTVTYKELYLEWNRHYESHCKDLELSEGALQFLAFMCDCDIRFVIISAAPRYMKERLESLGIGCFIDRMYFDVLNKTAVIQSLFAKEAYRKISPRDVFFMGDTVKDIVHGNQAGVATFAYTQGHHPVEALASAKPTHIVDSFRSALNMVRAQIPEYA